MTARSSLGAAAVLVVVVAEVVGEVAVAVLGVPEARLAVVGAGGSLLAVRAGLSLSCDKRVCVCVCLVTNRG